MLRSTFCCGPLNLKSSSNWSSSGQISVNQVAYVSVLANSNCLSHHVWECSAQDSLPGAGFRTGVWHYFTEPSCWPQYNKSGHHDTLHTAHSSQTDLSSHPAPNLPYQSSRMPHTNYSILCCTSNRQSLLPSLQSLWAGVIFLQQLPSCKRMLRTESRNTDLSAISCSAQTTPSGKQRSLLMQKIYNKFNPDSERWKLWMQELRLIGYTDAEAETLLSAHPKPLQYIPTGTGLRFQTVISLIVSETNLEAKDVLHMAKHHPYVMHVSHSGSAALIAWFRSDCGLSSEQVGSVLSRSPDLVTYRQFTLQERLNLFLALGVTPAGFADCLFRTPDLFKQSPVNLVEKFEALSRLFGVSALEVLEQHPSALLQRKALFDERVSFLRHLGHASPTLSNMCCGARDIRYSRQHLKAHQKRSMKSLSQLCHELSLLPGMQLVFDDLKLQPDSMTELQYYQAFVKWLPTQSV